MRRTFRRGGGESGDLWRSGAGVEVNERRGLVTRNGSTGGLESCAVGAPPEADVDGDVGRGAGGQTAPE